MPAFLIFRISDLHEATQTPLSGVGGVNINSREKYPREAGVRVSFSAQRKRIAFSYPFSLKGDGLHVATPHTPSRGRGCKYKSREMPANAGSSLVFRSNEEAVQTDCFFFDTMTRTKRPQTPLSGAGGVNIIREYLLTAKRVRVSFSTQNKKGLPNNLVGQSLFVRGRRCAVISTNNLIRQLINQCSTRRLRLRISQHVSRQTTSKARMPYRGYIHCPKNHSRA